MIRLGKKLISNGTGSIWHWCPACKRAHSYEVPRWTFNGSETTPDFKPSMLIYVPQYDHATKKFDDAKRRTCCHYFITNGIIEFCGDCPHEFKGKHVPLPDFPEGYDLMGFVT